jgi:hypothetical protein
MNYHLNKVIGENETGFHGTNDAPYRMEGWDFIVAGGGLYNNLDYSFTVGHEDGTFVSPAKQPGGGNPVFRKQMRVLRDFSNGFDFIRMKPDNSVLKDGAPPGLTARALVQPGRAYAIYLRPAPVKQGTPTPSLPYATKEGVATLRVDLPAGSYAVEWVDPLTGRVTKTERIKHPGGTAQLLAPPFKEDVALGVRAASAR